MLIFTTFIKSFLHQSFLSCYIIEITCSRLGEGTKSQIRDIFTTFTRTFTEFAGNFNTFSQQCVIPIMLLLVLGGNPMIKPLINLF